MNSAGEGESLHECARALVENAAQAGVMNAEKLLDLSPREIELHMQALQAQRRHRMEMMDLQGWIAGRYVLAAFHAPRRYPQRPDAVLKEVRPMSDMEMKHVFAALAARREE